MSDFNVSLGALNAALLTKNIRTVPMQITDADVRKDAVNPPPEQIRGALWYAVCVLYLLVGYILGALTAHLFIRESII